LEIGLLRSYGFSGWPQSLAVSLALPSIGSSAAQRVDQHHAQPIAAGVTAVIELNSPSNQSRPVSLLRTVQSQAKFGSFPSRNIIAFRRANHTFLYLYPRDT
jgi:hypothetical protein